MARILRYSTPILLHVPVRAELLAQHGGMDKTRSAHLVNDPSEDGFEIILLFSNSSALFAANLLQQRYSIDLDKEHDELTR